jgi:hypothetical protein
MSCKLSTWWNSLTNPFAECVKTVRLYKNLAFQLKEYESVNLTFASSIPDDLITFIHDVTTLYKWLSVWETQLSTQSDTSFSFSWTHNRSLFNTALQAFTQDIATLQNNPAFL